MQEAREAISEAISAAIVASFQRDLQFWASHGRVPGPPSVADGEYAPGHDASRVPPVPATRLDIDRDGESPYVVFTWKAESGDPPYASIGVPHGWLRDVVRPGYAVIDDCPVLQVLSHGDDGRPSKVLAAAVGGSYDESMHGWRAHGFTVTRDLDWAPDGIPHVILNPA